MLSRLVLALAILLIAAGESFGDLIFSETFGTPNGNTLLTAFNGGTNGVGLTFSGSGDVRTTTASSGYSTFVNGTSTAASGSGNVFLTSNVNASLIIGNINTTGFDTGSISLNFGAFKSTTASDLTHLIVAFSTDGSNFTNLNSLIPAQPTGSGTAIWRGLALLPTNLTNSSTLSLRFTNTSSTVQVRLDDISLSGTITAVPEPTAIAMISIIGCAGLLASYRRRKLNPKVA